MSRRPFVYINMAMTADGKIATANRQIASFGSRRDQHHLLELRAQADAVMAGARTVDANSIHLGPGGVRYRRWRLARGLAEYNLRVVVSGRASLSPQAEIFQHRFSPVIVLAAPGADRSRLAALEAVADEVKVFGKRTLDFEAALCWLRDKWGVKRLLIEGGGALNASVLRQGVVDELHLTVCPYIFGGADAPTLADGQGVDRLDHAIGLTLKSRKRILHELYLIYRVIHKATPRPRR
jgi:2,5-diamino-6-(ribosylamino)-4(3H)-pyrimidinone 5'-phosphate reductase